MINRSARLVQALTLAVERNAALFDNAQGLSEVRVNIKFDQAGHPCKASVFPLYELRLVSKSIEDFTFTAT